MLPGEKGRIVPVPGGKSIGRDCLRGEYPMNPEKDLALRRGGKILQLKHQLDNLYAQFRDQQVEKEQQVQEIFCQGNDYLKSAQTMREAEALLEQLKFYLIPEQRGFSRLPLDQAREMAADLCQKLQQEEAAARQALQKSLQQAVSSLLQGLELSRDIGRLGQLSRLAGDCGKRLAQLAVEEPGFSPQGGGPGVGSTSERPDH
jgi:hypothetical protein